MHVEEDSPPEEEYWTIEKTFQKRNTELGALDQPDPEEESFDLLAKRIKALNLLQDREEPHLSMIE